LFFDLFFTFNLEKLDISRLERQEDVRSFNKELEEWAEQIDLVHMLCAMIGQFHHW